MNITRNNYEEFFMLYADNELSTEQREAVEVFIASNTDLKHELELFQQFKLLPDENVFFENKQSLLKQDMDTLHITAAEYASYFVLYADNELTTAEKAAVENYVYLHPSLQFEFELIQQSKLQPDTAIVFGDKTSLYRKEENDKVIPFTWWRMAAAAAVILFTAGIFWLYNEKKIIKGDIVMHPVAAPVKQPSVQTNEVIRQSNIATQPLINTIAAAVTKKEPASYKKIVSSGTANGFVKDKIKNKNSNLPAVQHVTNKEDIDETDAAALASSTVSPVNKQSKNVTIAETSLAAAGSKPAEQQLVFLNPDENDKAKTSFASADNDNVEVLNTSVNTKSSLRGILRKASRLISKKTGGGDEDGNHKSILIGGFEIAVR